MLLLIQRRRSSALELENEIKIRSMLKLEKKNIQRILLLFISVTFIFHTRLNISACTVIANLRRLPDNTCIYCTPLDDEKCCLDHSVRLTVWRYCISYIPVIQNVTHGHWARDSKVLKDCTAMSSRVETSKKNS